MARGRLLTDNPEGDRLASGPPSMSFIQQKDLISERSVQSRHMEATILNAPFRLPADPVEGDLLAKYFRVLGDRKRLRILELVSEGERSVGELAELLGEPQSKVSNHLACLRWCGFVAT